MWSVFVILENQIKQANICVVSFLTGASATLQATQTNASNSQP
jgi:hypothetical protein